MRINVKICANLMKSKKNDEHLIYESRWGRKGAFLCIVPGYKMQQNRFCLFGTRIQASRASGRTAIIASS